jgi:hypothetical protein
MHALGACQNAWSGFEMAVGREWKPEGVEIIHTRQGGPANSLDSAATLERDPPGFNQRQRVAYKLTPW